MVKIGQKQLFQQMRFEETDKTKPVRAKWVLMQSKNDDNSSCEYDLIGSDQEDLEDSFESSSSSETTEDVSSTSSSSSSSSHGPLYELSGLMAQLPIRRGISKFYQGKSESFASLTSVKSIEELAKKKKFCCRSRRSMKSYGSGLDGQSQSQRLSPKATIAKKGSSSSYATTRSSISFFTRKDELFTG